MRSRRSTWREWRLPDRHSFIGVDCDSVRGVGRGRGQQDRVDDVDDAVARRHVGAGDLGVVHGDRIHVGYGQFNGGSAAQRTCSVISTAPHIMTEATSVDAYTNAMAQEVPSLIGRTVTASVFAAFVEIDIICLALASLTGSALPDLVVLFADLALAPLPDLPP